MTEERLAIECLERALAPITPTNHPYHRTPTAPRAGS